MATNILKGIGIEFHILQSFPVTCLNRDDVGAPKSALVGGVPRARVSSQCWKRQVRLALHDLGLSTGIRTKRLAEMIADACLALGASGEQALTCGNAIASGLTDDTLFFISRQEVERLAAYDPCRDRRYRFCRLTILPGACLGTTISNPKQREDARHTLTPFPFKWIR